MIVIMFFVRQLRISGDEAWLGTSVAKTLRACPRPLSRMKIVKFLQGNIIEMLQMGSQSFEQLQRPRAKELAS